MHLHLTSLITSFANVSVIVIKCRKNTFPMPQPSLYCAASDNSGELKECERKYQNI
jgi:hypothetical protein